MTRLPLSSLPARFVSVALATLAQSKYRLPSRWRDAAVTVTPEGGVEVIHRLELAARIRAGGDEQGAREIAGEVVRAREIIAYMVVDDLERGAHCACSVLTIGNNR